MRKLVVLGVAVALGLAAGASSAVPKVTLTVAITGSGTVNSQPAGLNCRPSCTLHGHRGEVVTLTATPSGGGTFSHWAPTCGSSTTCTIKLTGSRVIHAFFKAAPPSPPPPPPPPPPPAKGGHYKGTYSDGTFITFDVGPSGLSVGNIDYDLNGHCSDGGTSYGESGAPGPYSIQFDGSFQGTYSYTDSNATGRLTITGKFSQDGSASGNLNDTFTFTSGDAQGITCTTTGTWSAQVQP